MDNASAYGAEDSRFDPWQTRIICFHASLSTWPFFLFFIKASVFNRCYWCESMRDTYTHFFVLRFYTPRCISVIYLVLYVELRLSLAYAYAYDIDRIDDIDRICIVRRRWVK